jgi:hypothetical protein
MRVNQAKTTPTQFKIKYIITAINWVLLSVSYTVKYDLTLHCVFKNVQSYMKLNPRFILNVSAMLQDFSRLVSH